MAATLILDSEHNRAQARLWAIKAPDGTAVTFKKPGRSVSQNKRMWAMLTDVSQQTNHNGTKYSPEQWKALFMHACNHEVHFMPGLNGEPFPAGFRTSKLNVSQMTELMDFIESFGVQNGVNFGGGHE